MIRWWVFAVSLVLAAGVGFGIGALVWAGDSDAGRTTQASPGYPEGFTRLTPEQYSRCIREVTVHFDGTDPDPRMREAADQLHDDPRFESVRPRTRQESWEEFKRAFAGQPDVVASVTPEALPASVILTVRAGRKGAEVQPELEARFAGNKVSTQSVCPR